MQRPPPPQRSSSPALFRVVPACNASLFRPGFALDTFFAQLAAGALRPRVLSSAPWLLQLDDFTPMSVAAGMLEQVGRFRTSFVNTPDGYRISSYRNASQWGCVRCGSRSGQSAFATYVDRVHQALGLPHRQSSDLVVLRYGAGGYYRRHHDYLAPRSQPGLWRDRGPRQLTLMLYLSDNDNAAGGATRFYLDGTTKGRVVDVRPRVGRIVLWQNVRSRRLHEREDRTFHEALVLTAGVKYVATTWFHACDPRK